MKQVKSGCSGSWRGIRQNTKRVYLSLLSFCSFSLGNRLLARGQSLCVQVIDFQVKVSKNKGVRGTLVLSKKPAAAAPTPPRSGSHIKVRQGWTHQWASKQPVGARPRGQCKGQPSIAVRTRCRLTKTRTQTRTKTGQKITQGHNQNTKGLLDKTGTIVSESGTNSPVAH